MAIDAWKKLVAAPVASLLKQRGFRKAGLVFSAPRDGLVLLVTLQSSANSTQNSLKITCNLGIWVEGLARSPKPTVWEAQWRERNWQLPPRAAGLLVGLYERRNRQPSRPRNSFPAGESGASGDGESGVNRRFDSAVVIGALAGTLGEAAR